MLLHLKFFCCCACVPVYTHQKRSKDHATQGKARTKKYNSQPSAVWEYGSVRNILALGSVGMGLSEV